MGFALIHDSLPRSTFQLDRRNHQRVYQPRILQNLRSNHFRNRKTSQYSNFSDPNFFSYLSYSPRIEHFAPTQDDHVDSITPRCTPLAYNNFNSNNTTDKIRNLAGEDAECPNGRKNEEAIHSTHDASPRDWCRWYARSRIEQGEHCRTV